jgi:hypothetical protein
MTPETADGDDKIREKWRCTLEGSPVFGKKDKGSEDDNARFDPQVGSVLEEIKSLKLPQLAASVMSKAFSGDYQPGDTGWDVDVIAGFFSPMPTVKISDTMTGGRKRIAEAIGDPASNRAKWLEIKDLVGEGVQALVKVSLLVQSERFTGVTTEVTYTTTRAGRDAIMQDSVESLVRAGAS